MIRNLLGLLGAFLVSANLAAEVVPRHLPLTFDSASGPVRTSACAEVSELVYAEKAWWTSEKAAAEEPQRAFRSVVDAILRKDETALKSLSTGSASDESAIQQQLRMMLQQDSLLGNITDVHLYPLDPLLVAFARLEVGGKSGLGTFVFAKQAGRYLLLPVRPRNQAYELLRNWANSPWGLLSTDGRGFCANEEMSRANARVTTTSEPTSGISAAMPIDFELVPVSGTSTGTARSPVLRTYAGMRDTVQKNQFAQLVDFVGPEDSEAVRSLASDATYAAQRKNLENNIQGQDPVAVVDAEPLQVLYTRSRDGNSVTAWYFMKDEGKTLRWVNLSRLTRFDSVFKSGPLYDAMLTDTSIDRLKHARGPAH